MQTYNVPHPAYDESKVASMVATLVGGGVLPPILIAGESTALTGSHRHEAYMRWEDTDTYNGTEIPTVMLSDDDCVQAMIYIGLDPIRDNICDYDAFIEGVRQTSADKSVLFAIIGQ
jgi:hypothetical protein